MAVIEKKKEVQEVSYFGPGALRWLAANGVDYRALFSAAKKHENNAGEFEKTLRRKSLKLCENELNGYLREFRAAESELRRLAAFLSDPALKERFLSANREYSPEKYDSAVENVRKKATYCQNAAWAYEKAYANKYGARQEYQRHLFVREMARQLREEMEERAGKVPGSRPAEREAGKAAIAQRQNVERDKAETHMLVSEFMQDLRKKYGGEEKPPEKGEARIARAEAAPRYRRGYERAGVEPRFHAALGEPKYHRGDRVIRIEGTEIARRSVPRKTEELAAGEARISPKAPSAIARVRDKIKEVKEERSELKEKLSSLSGAEKKEASERLAELNKELFKLRRQREQLSGTA